jgi:hypothetical protein
MKWDGYIETAMLFQLEMFLLNRYFKNLVFALFSQKYSFEVRCNKIQQLNSFPQIIITDYRV